MASSNNYIPSSSNNPAASSDASKSTKRTNSALDKSRYLIVNSPGAKRLRMSDENLEKAFVAFKCHLPDEGLIYLVQSIVDKKEGVFYIPLRTLSKLKIYWHGTSINIKFAHIIKKLNRKPEDFLKNYQITFSDDSRKTTKTFKCMKFNDDKFTIDFIDELSRISGYQKLAKHFLILTTYLPYFRTVISSSTDNSSIHEIVLEEAKEKSNLVSRKPTRLQTPSSSSQCVVSTLIPRQNDSPEAFDTFNTLPDVDTELTLSLEELHAFHVPLSSPSIHTKATSSVGQPHFFAPSPIQHTPVEEKTPYPSQIASHSLSSFLTGITQRHWDCIEKIYQAKDSFNVLFDEEHIEACKLLLGITDELSQPIIINSYNELISKPETDKTPFLKIYLLTACNFLMNRMLHQQTVRRSSEAATNPSAIRFHDSPMPIASESPKPLLTALTPIAPAPTALTPIASESIGLATTAFTRLKRPTSKPSSYPPSTFAPYSLAPITQFGYRGAAAAAAAMPATHDEPSPPALSRPTSGLKP